MIDLDLEREEPANNILALEARLEFQKVEDWLFSKETLSRPVHEVEAEQEAKMREVNRLMLQAQIKARGYGERGKILEVEQIDGTTESFKRGKISSRKLVTIFGCVKVERLGYSRPGYHSVRPLEEKIQYPGRSYSQELQRRVVLEAVKGPFQEVCTSIETYTGVGIPKRSSELIVKEAAADFDAFNRQIEPPPHQETAPLLVAQVDCKGIPMVKPPGKSKPKAVPKGKGEKGNKKKMSTVAAAFTIEKRVRTPEEVVESLFTPSRDKQKDKKSQRRVRPEHKRIWASLKKGKDALIQELAEEVERRDPDKTKQRIGITDGENALQIRIQKFIPGLVLILDLFHVLGYLWKAAYAFCKEGSEEASEWVKKRLLMLLQGKVEYVVRGMRQSATKRKLSKRKRETVEKSANYLLNNKDYMRYDEYLESGFPIASGPIEGACKNLVKDRMERSGMRWTEDSAEAMLQMRALHLNGMLDKYWGFHVIQDQERLKARRGSPLSKRAA